MVGFGGRGSVCDYTQFACIRPNQNSKREAARSRGADGGTALGKICAYLMPTALPPNPPPQLANVPIGGLDLPRALIRLQQQKRKQQHHRQPTTENTPLSEGQMS